MNFHRLPPVITGEMKQRGGLVPLSLGLLPSKYQKRQRQRAKRFSVLNSSRLKFQSGFRGFQMLKCNLRNSVINGRLLMIDLIATRTAIFHQKAASTKRYRQKTNEI